MPLSQPVRIVHTKNDFVRLVPSYSRFQKCQLQETHISEALPPPQKQKRKRSKSTENPAPKQPKKAPKEVLQRNDRYIRRDANRYAPMTPQLLQRTYRHIDQLKVHLEAFPDDVVVRDMLNRHWKLAKDLLVRHNSRMVITIVNRYLNKGLDFEDLYQEGNIGLITAINKFDYKLGYKFSTYAVWWIKEGIDRAIKNKARTIRVPIGRLQKRVKVQKAYSYGLTHLKVELDSKQISQMTGISQKDVEEMKQYDYEIGSLDKKVSVEGDKTLGETLADNHAVEPIAAAAMSENQAKLIEKLDEVLGPEDARLIKRRFGLGGQHERTDSQLADIYGVKDAEIKKRMKTIFEVLKEAIDPTDFCFD